jgi:hypothetical protein
MSFLYNKAVYSVICVRCLFTQLYVYVVCLLSYMCTLSVYSVICVRCLFTQLYVYVVCLLTLAQPPHFTKKGEAGTRKSNVTLSLFIEMPVPS